MEAVFSVNNIEELEKRLRKMAGVSYSKTMKTMWSASIKEMATDLKAVVRAKYPHGTRKNSGMLRRKTYGPLADDIETKVWSKGGGANIYTYKRGKGRQCVLYWLDQGTRHISPAHFFESTVMGNADTILQKHVAEIEKDIVNQIMSVR